MEKEDEALVERVHAQDFDIVFGHLGKSTCFSELTISLIGVDARLVM